jgi:predicted transcriptional regulator
MAKRPSKTETETNTDPFGTKPVDEVGQVIEEVAEEAGAEEVTVDDLLAAERELAEQFDAACQPLRALQKVVAERQLVHEKHEAEKIAFRNQWGELSVQIENLQRPSSDTWPERQKLKKQHAEIAEKLKAAGVAVSPLSE